MEEEWGDYVIQLFHHSSTCIMGVHIFIDGDDITQSFNRTALACVDCDGIDVCYIRALLYLADIIF